ncbi:hypothetical protein [Paenibacillus sp. FSL H7-689]|uniref:hypothetical protein n=1 Tax=Paenibacillus sp. FSL H7-689 TaxID=1227349 RepID=UPI0003E25A4F|nr:hypothetical protein [Paenibacillus sp. FSL H7-689]ETT44739.1 hypothetical protein C170_22595 [Paenibacillus sp. FSL H7-689]
MEIDVQKLYQKYLTLEIANPFTLEQIHDRLTQKYYAKKVDLEVFADLRNDPEAHFDRAIAAYTFPDKRGINELIKLNKDEHIHEPLEFSWVIGSTVSGMSFLLNLEISIFHGIAEEEMFIGNLLFEEYLIALYILGYISFDDDPLIDKVIARYRDGYYLRHFGIQDGFEYLYK